LFWPGTWAPKPGDRLTIQPGSAGNYGYLRFDKAVDLPSIMGSRATNIRVGLGGQVLGSGDEIILTNAFEPDLGHPSDVAPDGPVRVLWGLHANDLPAAVRRRFLEAGFTVTSRMDRMGVRLDDIEGVFADVAGLSLVSDAIVPGDIQILGDGTPVVLMRDHQPTGGYPRIATIISADLDRFAQMRPGTRVTFESVTLAHAQNLRTGGGAIR
jgi:allophanate hydrolase